MTALLILFLLVPLQNSTPLHPQEQPHTTGHRSEARPPDKKANASVPSEERNGPSIAPEKAASDDEHARPAKGFDYIFWGFWVNFALVLATLVIAVFAVVQAIAAKDNASAARLNAEVLMESQRPRIVANAAEEPSKTFVEDTPRVKLMVTNKGPLPATEYRYESWIEILPDTSGDFTAAADNHKDNVTSVLYPGSPQAINIPLRKGISKEELFEVRKLRKHVCVRLCVEYKDPFVANRRCNANFGFYLIPGGLGFLEKHNSVGYKDKEA